MESPTDLLLLPFLLTFFGALVYGLMIDAGIKKGRLGASRWVGVGLILLALLAGFPDTWKLTDDFNRTVYADTGKKVLYSHFLSGLVPLIALLACLIIDFWARRRIAALAQFR